MGEVQTACIKTLIALDNPSDQSFRKSYSLVYENIDDCVCVFMGFSNNYGYQKRTGNYRGGSNAWETLYIATRKGYTCLGTRNIYDRNNIGNVPSAGDLDRVEVQDGNIIIHWKEREPSTSTISKDSLKEYDFPLELPPDQEMFREEFNIGGPIVVIDDDRSVEDELDEFVNHNRDIIICAVVLVNAIRYTKYYDHEELRQLTPDEKVRDMIRNNHFPFTLESEEEERLLVKLVLLDGSMFCNGREFNTGILIPKLRELYPNAIIFANSGKGHNHNNYNQQLIRAGCDCGLVGECVSKSDLRQILSRCDEVFPKRNIKRRKRLPLARVVGFDPIRFRSK